jgi:hypothetical protein
LTRLGSTDQAVGLLETAVPLLASAGANRVSEITTHGWLAVGQLHQGQLQAARTTADAVAPMIMPSSPTVFATIDAFVAIAEVYLALWELGGSQPKPTPAEGADLANAARQACQALHRYARTFPIGQPRAWLAQGLYEWLRGRPAQAHKAWHKSMGAAERLAMPYDRALAHYEIGRHLDPAATARQFHLSRAHETFTQLNAAYDLARTNEAMQTG